MGCQIIVLNEQWVDWTPKGYSSIITRDKYTKINKINTSMFIKENINYEQLYKDEINNTIFTYIKKYDLYIIGTYLRPDDKINNEIQIAEIHNKISDIKQENIKAKTISLSESTDKIQRLEKILEDTQIQLSEHISTVNNKQSPLREADPILQFQFNNKIEGVENQLKEFKQIIDPLSMKVNELEFSNRMCMNAINQLKNPQNEDIYISKPKQPTLPGIFNQLPDCKIFTLLLQPIPQSILVVGFPVISTLVLPTAG